MIASHFRILFSGFIGVFILCINAHADDTPTTLTESEIADLFSQGKELFRQANESSATDNTAARDLYQKAALRFERIAHEGGVDNGQLYYNIGNAYFRMKDIGRAILNYRRAELYTPNDTNLQQNLAFALQRRQDDIEVDAQRKVMETVFFWHYDVYTRARASAFAASFTGAWVFATLLLFRSRPWMKWCAGVSAVLAVILLASLIIEAGTSGNSRSGVIIADSTIARKGDSESYEPSFQDPLNAGTEFQLLEDRGNWLNISLADGRQCWLPSSDVEMVR
ncbi:MAG: tetratricopeptide (TPR) repeat protein [Verrucomicrobiales bacterium]|jgi:tetratricopeptide (TPR) repeat protein